MSLEVPSYKLEEISLAHSTDVARCKMSVITHWLNNDPEPSWRKLANALDECDYHVVATYLRQKYLPADSKIPGSGRISGNRRLQMPPPVSRTPSPVSQTPSPVSPNKRFHFRTNVLATLPLPPSRTIVVSITYVLYMYMSVMQRFMCM